MLFSIDIEPTNRCNAKCSFCPRDQTPHQGLMTPEVFEQTLRRAQEFRPIGLERADWGTQINLCGLGEPLLNKHTPEWVAKVREAGFECGMSTNGALLDERRAHAVLDAGLTSVFINIGDVDDTYEDVYQLPFEKTRDNVVRFGELAKGRCDVSIVLVDYRHDPSHLSSMRSYWQAYGFDHFVTFDVINRGGALFVDHMQYEAMSELRKATDRLAQGAKPPVCGAPFAFLFVGYDGKYYLCCSDWKKEIALGDVFERSFLDVTAEKFQNVLDRSSVCRTCNLDPTNQLAGEYRALADGLIDEAAVDAVYAKIESDNEIVFDLVDKLQPGITAAAVPTRRRASIPVTAL
jgi:MoaA/NifB/PqqE/SkfB family radical SAM enzyme